MKKVISVLATLVLIVSSLCILTGCEKGGKEENKVSKNAELVTLKDKYVGFEVTMEYPKDAGITVEEKQETDDKKTRMILKDGDITIEMFYLLNDSYNNTKKYNSQHGNEYKEFKAGDLDGFYYVTSSYEGKVYVLLNQVNEPTFEQNSLGFTVKHSDFKNHDAVKEYLASEKFTKMMESIKFNKTEVTEYKGKLSTDHNFGVNAKEMSGYKNIYTNLNANQVVVYLYKSGEEKESSNNLASITVSRYSGDKKTTAKEKAQNQLDNDKYNSYSGSVQALTIGNHTIYSLSYAKNAKRTYAAFEIDGELFELDITTNKLNDGEADVLKTFLQNVLDGVYMVK